ncbi:hypothetical protein MRX96_046362 [Rhipicephalus microplus]
MREDIPTSADLAEFLSLCRFLAEARVACILSTRAANTEGWQWFGQLMLLLAVVATAASGMSMQVVVHVTADKHPVGHGVALTSFSVLILLARMCHFFGLMVFRTQEEEAYTMRQAIITCLCIIWKPLAGYVLFLNLQEKTAESNELSDVPGTDDSDDASANEPVDEQCVPAAGTAVDHRTLSTNSRSSFPPSLSERLEDTGADDADDGAHDTPVGAPTMEMPPDHTMLLAELVRVL